WLGDIVSNLAPKRNLDEAVSIALLKSDTPVSWMASTLDKLNWAYVVERGADLSNAIERSARVQVYYDEVLGYIDNVARPALKTRAAEIGLPDGIARSFDGVFGPADILALKSKFAASEVPVVWASDLLPEGASDVLKGLAKEFDDYQKLIMQNFPEESVIQDMSEYIDELFTNTDGFTRNLDDAAQVEESLGEWWRGAMRGNVDNILQRSRDVRDDMLLTVRDRIAANPDAAGAYWTRYFAATNKVSREVWEEVVDITKRQMPTMSKSVDAMLTGYERSLADAIVPNMSTGDWGVFGEVLFERRQLVDGARDDMMNEFIKLLDDDSLTTVQAALDGVGNLADDAANKASVFRDGYLAQVQRAKPRITPEEYAAEMQRIWDESYFTPAREAFEAATQSITKGVGVGTPVQRAVPEEMADALDAQMDFEADMNLHNSSQYQQAAERMQQQALEWKNAVLGSLNDLARKISKGKIEVDTANTGIEELAKSWSGLMSDGRKAGALETANVLFDYSIKANWEEILGYFYPFTTWQTRNPNMWYQMTKNRPAIAGVVQRFNHLNQREMERNNLTSRFRGTVPVPGQEMLQAQGVLPEGSYAAL
ncbi:MAG: hypothetical protein KAJ19_08750, partial [Gammaproteobacteria bacterium]|nr:hypothetical protein [Gammaproteobacteria bacterium]